MFLNNAELGVFAEGFAIGCACPGPDERNPRGVLHATRAKSLDDFYYQAKCAKSLVASAILCTFSRHMIEAPCRLNAS